MQPFRFARLAAAASLFRPVLGSALVVALVTGFPLARGQEAAPPAPPATDGTAAPAAAPAAEVEKPPPPPFAKDHPLQPALATISSDDLKDHVAWLADDERKGRCAGEPGCDEAADYIAGCFEDWGLEPAGTDASWFQPFTFRVRGASGGREAQTRNVVALWPGSDPTLKDELIVVGAHYDHVGTGESANAGRIGRALPDDSIWNGADDNASGTSALLEVAQAFALSDLRPKRSILFILFSAEEQGLYGSLHYAQHPRVALEQTRAMVNMDMVGRNPGEPIDLGAMGTLKNDLWYRLVDGAWGAAPGLRLHPVSSSRPDSDHHSFVSQGVPALFVFTGMHEDYHKVGDSPEKLAYDHMTGISRFVTALVWSAANCDEPMQFEAPRFQPRPRRMLGLTPEAELTGADMEKLGLSKDQGGYQVGEIVPGSVAEKAGVQTGDVILSLNGKTLSPDEPGETLRRFVQGSPKAKDVPLVVLREGKQVTLTVRWE